MKTPIYRSTNSPLYALQHQKSTAKSAENLYSQNSEDRESTAEKTTASENLQSYNTTILRITASEIYSKNQQRISTAKQRGKNLQQSKLQHQKIYSKPAKNFYSKKAFTSREQSTKEIIYSISDKLHKAPTKDYIKEVTFQKEFKSHFQQDLKTSLSNSWTLSTLQPTNRQIHKRTHPSSA